MLGQSAWQIEKAGRFDRHACPHPVHPCRSPVTDFTRDEVLVPPTELAPSVERPAAHSLSFRTKSLYATGNLVDTVMNAALTGFLLFYLTIVCGLSGTLAGAAMAVALVVDAFIDPFVGSLSDNLHSRYGRRHPFMVLGVLPVGLALGLLFSVPAGLSGLPLFLYATACLLTMRFGHSAFNIPYFALGAELTDDYHERSIVVAYRTFAGVFGSVAPVVLGLLVFLKGPAVLQRGAYVPFAWSCVAIILAGGLISAFGTLDTLNRLHKTRAIEDHFLKRLLREIVEVFRNPSFRILFFALVIFFVAQGVAANLSLHAHKFFWNLPNGVIAAIGIVLPFGTLVGIPFISELAKHVEKNTLSLGGMAGFCLCQLTIPLLKVLDLLPPNGPFVYGLLLTNVAVAGVAITALVIGFQSMMADAADEHELLFGARREGLYFAGLNFSVKAAAGAGGFLAGRALDLIGFPVGIAAHGGANAHIPIWTLKALGLTYGPGAAILTSFSILILLGYKIDRKAHAKTLAELTRRRNGMR